LFRDNLITFGRKANDYFFTGMREQEKNFGKGMFIFARGLRHLLHHCVALTGFCKKERKKRKNSGLSFLRGAYATIAIIVSPFGL